MLEKQKNIQDQDLNRKYSTIELNVYFCFRIHNDRVLDDIVKSFPDIFFSQTRIILDVSGECTVIRICIKCFLLL